MDGELDEAVAEEVSRCVAGEADWRATHEDFRAVDAALELLEPARPRRDLTDRIVRATRRRRVFVRVAKVAAPLAAAASILLAVFLTWPADTPSAAPAPTGVEAKIADILKDVPKTDWFIVQNLQLFQNYEDVVDYQQLRDVIDVETLEALRALEAEGRM